MAGLLEALRGGEADHTPAGDLAHDGASEDVGGDAVLRCGLRAVHLTISRGGWLFDKVLRRVYPN